MSLLGDVRLALRSLRRSPGFAAVAVGTLALGIGADTAMFTFVDRVLLEPLPYRDPERVALLWHDGRERNIPQDRIALDELTFVEWRRQSTSFEQLAALRNESLALTDLDHPVVPLTHAVTTNYFELLGVVPALGRLFQPGDDEPGRERVVVLSHALWQDVLGGDPGLVGGTLRLDGEPFTVLGVLSPDFWSAHIFDVQPDLWVPRRIDEAAPARVNTQLAVYGRLRPGVDRRAAEADLQRISEGLGVAYPDSHAGWRARVVPVHQDVIGDFERTFVLLFAAVGLVLLVACANVASLLLARGLHRRGELAVRAALGASRGRLVRQLLVESALLGLLGAAGGVLLAAVLLRPLARLVPEQAGVPFLDRLAPDTATLVYAALVGLGCAVLFGLLPARRSAGIGIAAALRESGRGAAGGTLRLRSLLIAGEVAASVVLLVGAGLVLQSFAKLRGYEPGFAAAEVLSLRNSLRGAEFATPAQRAAYFEEAAARLRRLPGVREVSAGNFGPPLTGFQTVMFARTDRPVEPGREPVAVKRQVLPAFFETLGIPLLAGRGIETRDGAEAQAVTVVNQQLAETYFDGDDPVGRYLTVRGEAAPRLIVGVAGNERGAAPDPRPMPALYVPHAQDAIPVLNLLVRTDGAPAAELGRAAELALWSLSRSINVYQVETLEARLDDLHWRWRFATQLLAGFALFALLLGAVGLYSVVSYAVGSRRRELAVRLAFGAGAADVARLVLYAALRPTLVGVAAGLAMSAMLGRLLESMLYETAVVDPGTWLAVAVVLIGTASLAALEPALRAARIDPARSLRES